MIGEKEIIILLTVLKTSKGGKKDFPSYSSKKRGVEELKMIGVENQNYLQMVIVKLKII